MSTGSDGKGSGGDTFLDLLAVLFIGLKLAGLIDWPWLWVLAPLWFQLAFLVLALLFFFVLYWAER